MTIRHWSLAITVLLTGCANKPDRPPSLSNTSKAPRVEIYQRGDGRDSIGCINLRILISARLAKSSDTYSPTVPDHEFECVFDDNNLIAVPKQGFAAGETYSVFDATLTVERCFGEKDPCEVAMISSMCADEAV